MLPLGSSTRSSTGAACRRVMTDRGDPASQSRTVWSYEPSRRSREGGSSPETAVGWRACDWPAGCGADYGTYNNWYGSAPSGAEGDCVWNRYYNQWYAVPGDGGNGGYGDAYCYCQVAASLAPTREPTAAPTRNIPPSEPVRAATRPRAQTHTSSFIIIQSLPPPPP